ncbi:MAG: YraN family protein [Oceanococcaceae bacterium]
MSGQLAEDQACQFLQMRGLQLITRNFRCRRGEIDIIMNDGGTVVFVEVRQRQADALVGAAASVSSAKQQRLIAAARFWIARHPTHAAAFMRFDLVAIDGDALDWQQDVLHVDG